LTRDDLGGSNEISEDLKTVMTFVEWFETTSKCTGICKKSLFYFSLSLTEGVPDTTCLLGVKELIKTNMWGLGLCILITGVIMFLTFICQYCLWKKRDK